MACISRTVDDVESLIEFAKLSSNSLLSTTQTLEFPELYNPHENILLQLPQQLLAQLKQGDTVVLRGEPEDCAVLCTDNKTYEVREAETSNSMVLVPDLSLPDDLKDNTENRQLLHRDVSGIYLKYLEVRECVPRLRKLRELLLEAPYAGPATAQEDCEDRRQYSFSELLERVQCSEDEMREALALLPAMHMDGHWRALQFDYQFSAVSAILGVMEEQLWPVDAVPRGQVLAMLRGVEPLPVLKLCLGYYFTEKTASAEGASDDDQECALLSVNDDRLSCLLAEVLLRPAGKFNLNEFLTIWQQSVPNGVNTHLSQLEGIALIDRDSSPAVVWHYPVHQLPEDPALRFQQLFQTRDKWTQQDITPYIQELSSSKCSVKALLAKHTRASTHQGIKYYTAKHSR